MVCFISKLITMPIPVSGWRKAARDAVNRWLTVTPYRIRGVKFGGRFRLHGSMHVTRFCRFADDVHVNSLHVEGVGEFTVGSHTHFGREVLAITSSHDYRGTTLPYDRNHIVRHVRIGECVWIGDRVTLLPGAEIGDGAIIQAGAVVHGKIPPLSIAGGNPAKVFATRDAAHYEGLRSKGAYKW